MKKGMRVCGGVNVVWCVCFSGVLFYSCGCVMVVCVCVVVFVVFGCVVCGGVSVLGVLQILWWWW